MLQGATSQKGGDEERASFFFLLSVSLLMKDVTQGTLNGDGLSGLNLLEVRWSIINLSCVVAMSVIHYPGASLLMTEDVDRKQKEYVLALVVT